jgi:ketosteroid isomerase-like protein
VSHENVEIVSAVIAAFSRAGVDAALSYFTPNVEWFAPPEWPEDRRYEGYDGLKKLASVWTENFDNFELELNRTIDAGDHVVVLLYQRGRIRRGSAEVEHRTAWDCELRGGMIARVSAYFSWEEALKAVGLEQ